MTRTSTGIATLVGVAVFLLGGIHQAHALPNTGGAGGADYCRSHCAPIARQAARDSCFRACVKHRGPVKVGCLVGANGCLDAATHSPAPRSPAPVTLTPPGSKPSH